LSIEGSGAASGEQAAKVLDAPHLARLKAVERKIFWITFTILGLAADFVLPMWWALFAGIPICLVSWWVAYRSDWF
jgi:hypothetical protein